MAYLINKKTKIKIDGAKESESVEANITQYAIENGSPLSDHTQRASKSIQITGFLLGKNADKNYKTLMGWQDKGVELQWKGRIYHNGLMMSGLTKSYDHYKNGFDISFTLNAVKKAKTSWKKKKKKKKKKGKQQVKKPKKKSKKKYVTVKRGNTYWGWMMKYGTSIKNLRKWNKWPDRFIPIGKRARVK